MTKRIGLAASLCLWAGLGASTAQAAEAVRPCVPPAEATALLLFVAPDAITAVGTACSAVLPPTALLRQTSGPFLDKYRAASRGTWDSAKSAIGRITGNATDGLLDSDQFRPLVSAMIAPMIVKQIKTKDCAKIERVVTLLAPLPARNAAELVVVFAQMSDEKKTGKLPICAA